MKNDGMKVILVEASRKKCKLIFIPWCLKVMLVSRFDSPNLYADYLTDEIVSGRRISTYLPHMDLYIKENRLKWWEFKKKKLRKRSSIQWLSEVKDLRPMNPIFRRIFNGLGRDEV